MKRIVKEVQMLEEGDKELGQVMEAVVLSHQRKLEGEKRFYVETSNSAVELALQIQ
jgi:hypothetical protein